MSTPKTTHLQQNNRDNRSVFTPSNPLQLKQSASQQLESGNW
jgi:hypothetical protein